MWLQKGEQVVLVPAHMPDTITRCLDGGWVEIPDPRTQVAPPSVSEPEPQPQPQPAHHPPARHQKGRR